MNKDSIVPDNHVPLNLFFYFTKTLYNMPEYVFLVFKATILSGG